MKQRRNQLVAIVASWIDDDPDDVPMTFHTAPLILAGGLHAEANRVAVAENMARIYGGQWTARIAYRWRSKAHLMRHIRRPDGKWRGQR